MLRGPKSLRAFRYSCEHCGGGYNVLHMHYGQNPACMPPELMEDDSDLSEEELPEPSTLGLALLRDDRKEMIATNLSDLRYEHGMNDAAIVYLKNAVTSWVDDAALESLKNIMPLVRKDIPREVVLEKLKVELFADLDTPKKELAFMKVDKPYLEPRVVDVGDGEVVASFHIGKLIERKLQHDPVYAAMPRMPVAHMPVAPPHLTPSPHVRQGTARRAFQSRTSGRRASSGSRSPPASS